MHDSISLIYWLLALHTTIEQANLVGRSLAGGIDGPIVNEPASVVEFIPFPPVGDFFATVPFYSSVSTSNHLFTVRTNALILARMIPGGGLDWRFSRAQEPGKVPGPSAKDPIQLARTWLANMGVNIRELEKEYRPEALQVPFEEASNRFTVTWLARRGKSALPAVYVTLNTAGPDLLEFYLASSASAIMHSQRFPMPISITCLMNLCDASLGSPQTSPGAEF
jgi:hypothetical protein